MMGADEVSEGIKGLEAMPLDHQGIVTYGSSIDKDLEEKIKNAFRIIDRNVASLSKLRGLYVQQVRLLQLVHFVVLVRDSDILVIISPGDTGSIAINEFQDWTNKQIDLQAAILVAERDLAFRNTFGLQFPRSIVDLDDGEREKALAKVARQYIDSEIANLERLKNIVRINPVFKGRDFSINHSLVFVLSPFGEPFDTIFSDHVKPTIEGIGVLSA